MLYLNFAPSADLLVPILLGRLRSLWRDPFVPPAMIVPSPAVGKWLQLRLTDCKDHDPAGRPLGYGCTANLKMLTLEKFLWEALQPDEEMEILDVSVIHQVVCALLDDDLLRESRYQSLQAYLGKPDGTVDPVKRVQLALRIAHQFQEYEFNRPSVWDAKAKKWKRDGIDACWLKKKRYKLPDGSDIANPDHVWQRDLYFRTHECLQKGYPEGSDKEIRMISLPHLHRLRREQGCCDDKPWAVTHQHIFLFQVSKISHFHRNLLVEISQMPGVNMHLFLTNPCAEFWEDVDTWRNGKSRRSWRHNSRPEEAGVHSREPEDYDKGELDELPKDPPLLELWGRAGKENIYLWCPQAQWNFDYYSPIWVDEDKRPGTLLEALQLALLRRDSNLLLSADEIPVKHDGSLMVLACPDPVRELEELREQILDLAAGNAIEKLNEVVVYLPHPGEYLPRIHGIFDSFRPGDPGYIPFTVLGAPGSDSLLAQGMQTLLEIAEGSFDRAHVFALLRNPIVQHTRKFSPEDVTVWEGWAEELGIFRGYDREHRRQMRDEGQTVTDAHTFGLGMARMLIGNLAAGSAPLNFRLLDGSGDDTVSAIPVYRDFDTSDDDLVEDFCSVIDSLHEDTQGLADDLMKKTLPESVHAMAKLAEEWFGDIPHETGWNMAAEEMVLKDFLKALPCINMQACAAGRRDRPGLKEFLELVRGCLPEELSAVSRAWTGGITFAPLRPGMIIPHKVIFVLGLDAIAFPGIGDKPAWNLLAQHRIIGDSDPVRDNRFAFLELVHAAEERLILSFRARNMQKEEDLQPSSVILELESYLKSQGLRSKTKGTNEECCLIRREIPWIIHESISEKKTSRDLGSWDPAEVRLAAIENRSGAKKAKHRYSAKTVSLMSPAQGPLHTSIYHLRKFYANPLEYHLSKTLSLELDEQPSTMTATDEPLQSGALEMSMLQNTIWTELLQKVFPENREAENRDSGKLAGEAEKIAGKVHQKYLVQGASPEAQFCLMERQYLIHWARECVKETLALSRDFVNHRIMRDVDLSLNRDGVPGELEVDLGGGLKSSVVCRHRLVLVPRDDTGLLGILQIKKDGNAKENPDLWLSGVIQWLAEKNLSGKGKYGISMVQMNRGDGKEKTIGFDISRIKQDCTGDAGNWLAGEIREMAVDFCADHLPFAVVKDLTKQFKKNPIPWDLRWSRITRRNIEEKLSGDEYGPYTCYLESFRLVEARIPDGSDKDLRNLAQKRFAPMLEGWIHDYD